MIWCVSVSLATVIATGKFSAVRQMLVSGFATLFVSCFRSGRVWRACLQCTVVAGCSKLPQISTEPHTLVRYGA